MNGMEKLKSLLEKEAVYRPSEEAMDSFLNLGTIVELKPGEILIKEGSMDSDIYILKEGVIRHVDLHGEKEQTFAFGRPGTIYMSMFPFVYHKPSYWQYEACCRTEVLKIKQEDFWRMVNSNHEVAVWMLRLAYGQIAFLEYINSDIKDSTAQERFLSLLEKRPEIIRLVPQKIIASYLDITPEYFSHLKKKFMKTERQ